jgi:DNA-binding Lrp family transcriptional regulator
MSRGARTETREPEPSRSSGGGTVSSDAREVARQPREHGHAARAFDVRQPVRLHDRVHCLRESEWRTLRTVGTFRVVSDVDLLRDTSDQKTLRNDLLHLVDEGLLERKTAIVNHHPTRLLTLTDEGKALVDRHRDPTDSGRTQQYYAGLVKPRELAHDVQLYRAYRAEARHIEEAGGRIRRVVLDYELKRDYQQFLNRRDRPADATFDSDLQAFSNARRLPVVDGHLELPDVRLEYETADGRLETRDLEVVTEHYSRSQMAGKARAGFALCRPARVSPFGRGGASSRGGTPVDPHTLDWLK